MQEFLISALVAPLSVALPPLLCMVSGPFIGYGLLRFDRRRARRARKASIVMGLLRSPGETLRVRIEDCRLDFAAETAAFSWAVAMLLWCYYIGPSVGLQTRDPVIIGALALAGIAALTLFVRSSIATNRRLGRLRAGYDAEVAVGQELNQLMRAGAFVFHDIPAEGFNVDHVVVCEEGVFAVETKGYTKPNRSLGKADAIVSFDGRTLRFPTWSTSAPIEQAQRQCAWLARWLSDALAEPVQVLPVVALPGWYVERTGRGDVRVFNGRELAGLLRSRGATRLPEQAVLRIANQLEARCRDVNPTLHRSFEQA